MWGTGTDARKLPPEMQGPQKDILVYTSATDPAKAWVPLENGKNDNWDGGGQFGCEASLMQALAAASTNKPVYLYKNSAAGSSLEAKPTENDWSPDSHGELLDGFLGGIGGVKESLKALGLKPNFRGFIWMQGETDSNSATGSAAYQANLAKLIDWVRQKADAPDMPVYIGRIHSKYAGPYLQEVRAAEANLATSGHNIIMFDTDGLPLNTDSIHFTGDAQITIGQKIFDIVSGKTKLQPAKLAPNQTFTVAEGAGADTEVGTLTLAEPGLPTPTFVVEGNYLKVAGETGKLKIKDPSAIDPKAEQVKVNVATINGVAPVSTTSITIKFKKSDPNDPIAGLLGMFNPDDGSLVTASDTVVTELRAANDATKKYTTATGKPIRQPFPGSKKQGLTFDGTAMMRGPSAETFLTPNEDEDFTIAAAVHIPVHTSTAHAMIIVINKSDVGPALALGFDYPSNSFFYNYSNPLNNAVEEKRAPNAIEPGSSHVVRVRKVGDTCRLFIDGKMVAESVGNMQLPILLGPAAPIGLGGMFPPAPSFTGSLGGFYLVKGVPTSDDESRMEKDLETWVTPTP